MRECGVPRAAAAALLSVLMSMLLVQRGNPRNDALIVAIGLTLWGLAVVALLRHRDPKDFAADRRTLIRLLAVALAVRLPLSTWPPTLSDDVWRYLWEGHVWRQGLSPFELPPNAPELAAIRTADWAMVNHPEVSSIYPPLAQLLFATLGAGGLSAWKLGMIAADLATVALLFRREPRLGWLWACLPLAAVESAANGHLEAAGCLLLALALNGSDLAAWLGGLLKLLPGVLLLRRPWRVQLLYGALTVLAFLPLLGPATLRGFDTYRTHWSFNGGLAWLAAFLLGDALARPALQALGLALGAAALWRLRHPARVALAICGLAVCLSPTVHPWYGLWPLVPALFLEVWAWAWFAALLPLAYVVLEGYDGTPATWHERPWVRAAIWLPFFVLLAREGWRRFAYPNPHPER